MIRCIIAAVVGAIGGGVFNIAVITMLTRVIYPLPEGADMQDPATMAAFIEKLPLPGFLLVLVAHAGGALVGGFIAALIARRSQVVLGAIVGGLFLIGGILAAMQIPAPAWFLVVDLILYVPAGILGAKLAPRSAASAAVTHAAG